MGETKARMANRMRARYYGVLSIPFWKRVNALPEGVRDLVYLAGCGLQDHEERVLQMLALAEQQAKKARRG